MKAPGASPVGMPQPHPVFLSTGLYGLVGHLLSFSENEDLHESLGFCLLCLLMYPGVGSKDGPHEIGGSVSQSSSGESRSSQATSFALCRMLWWFCVKCLWLRGWGLMLIPSFLSCFKSFSGEVNGHGRPMVQDREAPGCGQR